MPLEELDPFENRPLDDLPGRKSGFQDAPGSPIAAQVGSKHPRKRAPPEPVSYQHVEPGQVVPADRAAKPRVPKGRR